MTTEATGDLRRQQLLFANYVRDPSSEAPLDIEPRRLRIYRQLFLGNIKQLLATTFPVIRSIHSDEGWGGLVEDFYARHRCKTPLFPYIAEEFVDFLLHERADGNDYPFLAELAQYEWSEIALRHSDAEFSDLPVISGSLGDKKPRLSPLCFPMAFKFPVHRIGVGFLPETAHAELTYLLVYRDREENVRFIESTAATFYLLQLLQDDSIKDMPDLQERLFQDIQGVEKDVLFSFIEDAMHDLTASDVLI